MIKLLRMGSLTCLLLGLGSGVFSAEGDVVGEVLRADGVGLLRRAGERPVRLEKSVSLLAGDQLRTLEGTAELSFTDGARLSLEAFSRFSIGEESGSTESTPLVGHFELGESRFRSGNRPGDNYRLTSPTAVIGIRGTYFKVEVGELGETLVVLLQDLDGTVGELIIASQVDSVTLSQPNQGTRISDPNVPPSTPSIISLDLSIGAPRPSSAQEDIASAEAGTGDALSGAIDALNADQLRFRELDQDFLSIRGTDDDLDRDLLTETEEDGLSGNPFADRTADSDGASEVAITSEVTPEGVAVNVTKATTTSGTAVEVAVPATGNAAVVIDPNASVDAAAAANGGANLIIIKPTP
jgi:hypothetical protein